MTIKEKIHFNYDGIWADHFGIIHVTLDNGLFEESLVAPREIIETNIKGKDRPLFNRVNDKPMEFDMVVAFEEGFDDRKLEEVSQWLFQDSYKPLYFQGNENKLFYCMAVNEPKITHNGFGGGYITFQMRCNSPYVYSQVILSDFYDLTLEGSQSVELYNLGYGDLYPEISIVKVGAGDILIRNITHYGEEFEVNDLTDGEDIYINCAKRIIKTDLEPLGVYRYNNVVGNYLRLVKGRNVLEITGNCKIQFRYQYKHRF